jgi:hypothetical protein
MLAFPAAARDSTGTLQASIHDATRAKSLSSGRACSPPADGGIPFSLMPQLPAADREHLVPTGCEHVRCCSERPTLGEWHEDAPRRAESSNRGTPAESFR